MNKLKIGDKAKVVIEESNGYFNSNQLELISEHEKKGETLAYIPFEKVKVSEEVDKFLEYLKQQSKGSLSRFIHKAQRCSHTATCESVDEYMLQNNLTYAKLEQAFLHGWDTVREFQVGDIVYHKKNDRVIPKLVVDCEKYLKGQIGLSQLRKNKDDYTLMFKAENREDLKGCESE
jgi:hypothetical protein